jgi:hypothetical protein
MESKEKKRNRKKRVPKWENKKRGNSMYNILS